jgi:ribose 5-phosphate isomerase A
MNLKEKAAEKALEFVKEGMVLGLGTGSTTAYFINMLGEKNRSGALRDIRCVPTSEATAETAKKLGIPLTTLGENPRLDLAIDGADEVDSSLNLIKGLGRALLREKIVEIHAKRLIIIIDSSKMVEKLGTRGALPIEIIPFEANAHLYWLNTLGCRAELWLEKNGAPVITDNGNYLVRSYFKDGIDDAHALAQKLSARPGIVEHGLFLDMATEVIVARGEGVERISRKKA